ncbi:MAG TPA: SWIM zinc finger family protein [Capsulimonadaceae bacterium]|nr:SWIM zinc finger family protein [Capsulimonadaceae bacterium]
MSNGAEVKNRFKPLAEHDIEMAAGLDFYWRGETYFLEKRIFDAKVRGSELTGRCEGSAGGPYVVHATLSPADDPIAASLGDCSCDCPREGFCKHIVALLLTWENNPERFELDSEAGAQA